MNRDKIGTQTCYIHQCTNKGMLIGLLQMYSSISNNTIPPSLDYKYSEMIQIRKLSLIPHGQISRSPRSSI